MKGHFLLRSACNPCFLHATTGDAKLNHLLTLHSRRYRTDKIYIALVAAADNEFVLKTCILIHVFCF